MSKWKRLAFFIITGMACMLFGCSQEKAAQINQQEESVLSSEETTREEGILSSGETMKEEGILSSEETMEEESTLPTEEEDEEISDNERAEQNKAYGGILWDVYYFGQIEGREYTSPNPEGNKNGSFAIYDIDGDGFEELLLLFDGGYTAANVEYIWGYKNGNTHVELCEWPSMRYYNSGIIEVDWSHNQGLAGDFWPYSVYIYNGETDEYQKFAAVDAWDKILTEIEVRAEGEAFPSNIDADGDGIVYYILPADWDGYYDMTPLDGKEYENWRNDYLNGAEEIRIADIIFQPLNEENISKLGATKPDIQFPEPLG